MQFLIEEYLREKVVLDAPLDDTWPVIGNKLELGVVVLDPFGLSGDGLLHMADLLVDVLRRNADQVLNLDHDASEEAQIVSTFTVADDASEHVVLRVLALRVVQVPQIEVLG